MFQPPAVWHKVWNSIKKQFREKIHFFAKFPHYISITWSRKYQATYSHLQKWKFSSIILPPFNKNRPCIDFSLPITEEILYFLLEVSENDYFPMKWVIKRHIAIVNYLSVNIRLNMMRYFIKFFWRLFIATAKYIVKMRKPEFFLVKQRTFILLNLLHLKFPNTSLLKSPLKILYGQY